MMSTAARLLGFAALAAGLVLAAAPAHARVLRNSDASNLAEGTVGVGLQLGCPTGVSVKARLGAPSSAQFEGGFGCGEDLILTGDYLLEMSNFIVDPHNFQVSWYFGIGGRFAYNHDRYYGPANKRYYHRDTDLGPRVPIGVEARFAQVKPLEVYFEAAPGIDFVDETGLTVDVALGARWFF